MEALEHIPRFAGGRHQRRFFKFFLTQKIPGGVRMIRKAGVQLLHLGTQIDHEGTTNWYRATRNSRAAFIKLGKTVEVLSAKAPAVDEHADEIEDLQRKHRGKIDSLRGLLQENNETIRRLVRKSALLGSNNSTLKDQLAARAEELTRTCNERDHLKMKRDELGGLVNVQKQTISQYGKDLQQLSDEYTNIMEFVERLNNELEETQENHRRLMRENLELREPSAFTMDELGIKAAHHLEELGLG